MTAVRQRLHIFILSDMVQIKRGRKSIELMPFDEADALGRDLCLAVAAARATQTHEACPPPGIALGSARGRWWPTLRDMTRGRARRCGDPS